MDEKIIRDLVAKYCEASHTQEKEAYYDLWNLDVENVLIAPKGSFTGIESIYNDFLLGKIRAAYTKIDIIPDDINVRVMGDCAVVVFAYHTDCIMRDTGEAYGIRGLETQVYNKTDKGWKMSHIHYTGSPLQA